MKGTTRIQQSLVRGSGKFYCDTSIILVAFTLAPPAPPPLPSLGSQSPIYSLGSQLPIYSLGSHSPIDSLGSHSPIYSVGSHSPIYSVGSQSLIYSLGSVWSCINVYVYLFICHSFFIYTDVS